jgi:hypothetical protein
MMLKDLLSVGDKMSAFLGVANDSGTGHGQFKAKVQFDGGIDDGIEPKDFLFAIGVLGVTPDTDSGIPISGKFGAAKGERIRIDTVIQGDLGDNAPLDDEIELGSVEFLL